MQNLHRVSGETGALLWARALNSVKVRSPQGLGEGDTGLISQAVETVASLSVSFFTSITYRP